VVAAGTAVKVRVDWAVTAAVDSGACPLPQPANRSRSGRTATIKGIWFCLENIAFDYNRFLTLKKHP
jgi:hypothetical protein